MATKKFKSDAFAAIHNAASGMRHSQVISKMIMRKLNELRIEEAPQFALEDIAVIHKQARVNQSVFAIYLNTSKSTLQKSESGQKQPSGRAAKLLAVIKKHGFDILA